MTGRNIHPRIKAAGVADTTNQAWYLLLTVVAVIDSAFNIFGGMLGYSATGVTFNPCATGGTFIISVSLHLLILVSRCEPVRIAPIMPTCALPFPISFGCYVCIPRAVT